MMKRALLLLSLLSVPCVVTSCKDDAAPGTSITTESLLDKMCNLLKLSGYSEKEIKIFRAGYTGDTAILENLKDGIHIDIYCMGAAAAGNKELVLQCLDKGTTPNRGLYGAAMGGQKALVLQMLGKGAALNWGLEGAALGGHMDIVQFMLDNGAHPNAGLEGAA